MIDEIKGMPISDATARLIACQRFTDDVYENIMHALSDMYGEYVSEELMEKKCLHLFNEVEGVIRELIAESIAHNVGKNKPSEL
nr:MAG TPA: hypothetical protein [Caudoviricetes sp.]